jgi:hypothetical protein
MSITILAWMPPSVKRAGNKRRRWWDSGLSRVGIASFVTAADSGERLRVLPEKVVALAPKDDARHGLRVLSAAVPRAVPWPGRCPWKRDAAMGAGKTSACSRRESLGSVGRYGDGRRRGRGSALGTACVLLWLSRLAQAGQLILNRCLEFADGLGSHDLDLAHIEGRGGVDPPPVGLLDVRRHVV